MPHQCVRCNKFYDDGSTVILKGCDCGGKLFFYIKKSKLEEAKQIASEIKLTDQEKEQIEKDVYELIGDEDPGHNEPVILDLEAIRVTKPGQYELDLVHIFKGEPIVFKLEEGKYFVDIVQSFKNLRKKLGKK